MSHSGITKFDRYLTRLGLAFPTGNLIGQIVAPNARAENATDKVFVDGDDAINQMNDLAEATPSNEVDFEIGTPYTFAATRKALNTVVKDKEANDAEAIVRLKQRATGKLTNRLKIKHEKRVADIMTDTAKVTQTKDVDGTANARWDESTPDLEGDIIVAVKAIQAASGSMANSIVIPFDAALYAANMDFIKDTLQYQHGMEVVTAMFQKQVMDLVGLPPFIKGLKVIISSGRINNANKGQTKSVENPWGKDCLIGYIPPSLTVDIQVGIATMEYAPLRVFTERLTDPLGTKVIVDWDYDILEADLTNWYLLQNVIG